MFKKIDRRASRKRKHLRHKDSVRGTSERPRISVFRSAKNIYAQIIDDKKGITLVSASTVDKELSANVENGGNIEAAKLVGSKLAERALKKDIETVVFDKSGYLYTGRIQALADAAREAGLKF
ncbi:MAG: 50S ribosomal protein L18 [Fusobacteriota bacterium]